MNKDKEKINTLFKVSIGNLDRNFNLKIIQNKINKKIIIDYFPFETKVNENNNKYKYKNIGKFNYYYDHNLLSTIIFGSFFVERNKNKIRMIVGNKEEELKETLSYYEMANLSDIFFIKIIILSDLKDISMMFFGCSSLISVIKLNLNNVNNIEYIFYDCSSLKSLPDISKWNPNNVINMKKLFYNCASLKSLPDISKWNINNVTNIKKLF